MPIKESEIQHFEEKGFLAKRNVLTSLEVKALKTRLFDIGNGIIAFPEQHIQLEPLVMSGKESAISERFDNIRKFSYLTKFDTVFAEYARHPKILDVISSLLGPDIKIFLDQTLCKPPKVGSAKPPHQDSAYWTTLDPPNIVICWMALDDANESNGCMRFYPGSHKKGIIEHKHLEDFRVEDRKVDYTKEVPLPLYAGSCSFHHSLILHRTSANTSHHRRIGVTVGYMSARSKYIGESPKPDFELVCGQSYSGCV